MIHRGDTILRHWLAGRRPGAARSERGQEREYADETEDLHRRFLAEVYAYVARRVSHRQEAEDITAEVFAAAFTALPRPLGPHGPYPWLLGIARRKIADSHRKAARRGGASPPLPEDLPAAASAGPEAALAHSERSRRLQEMLAALPEPQREALRLHYVEDLSQAEVAVVLGRSAAAVNSLLQRARAAMYRQGHDYFLEESDATP